MFPHYCDEAYELYYSLAHGWFSKRGTSIDEVVLFKLDDSSDAEAKCEISMTQRSFTPPLRDKKLKIVNSLSALCLHRSDRGLSQTETCEH